MRGTISIIRLYVEAFSQNNDFILTKEAFIVLLFGAIAYF